MNKKNETLKDLMIELDKTYKQYGDEAKVKQILEANGYKVQVITNYNWFIDLDNNKFLKIDFGMVICTASAVRSFNPDIA